MSGRILNGVNAALDVVALRASLCLCAKSKWRARNPECCFRQGHEAQDVGFVSRWVRLVSREVG